MSRDEPVHTTDFDYDKLTRTFFVWCNVVGCRWTANHVKTMQDAKAAGQRHTENPRRRP